MKLQQIESQRVQGTLEVCCQTASHVPQDKAEWKPEPQTKSAKEILEHLAASNHGVAAILSGKVSDAKMEKAQRKDVTLNAGSYEEALDALRHSGKVLSESIAALSDEQLAQTRQMPWGEDWEVPRLLAVASSHIAYHMGQLGYLQTMWGDGEDYL